MSKLFQPLQIRNITLKNRLAVSPMCQYSSIDGFANDWHLVHLGSRAVGGAGLIITEATAVSPDGRITHDDLGIWKDEHIPFLKRITGFLEQQHAVPAIQLAHAGRKASHSSPWKGNTALTETTGAWKTFAPSAIAYKPGEPVPQEMNKDEISKLIRDFADAAKRAVEAGFKLIELHAAHGYLIHEFLSPLSNERSDEYGGSFENRTRLLMEIVEAVRKSINPGMPLFVRISASDWVEAGWNVADSVMLTDKLLRAGVDLIDCSSGGNSPLQKIPVAALYQVPFSAQIKRQTGILTAAVGLITTIAEVENILVQNQADLVVIGRQFLRDPYFALHAARESGTEIDWPLPYQRAK